MPSVEKGESELTKCLKRWSMKTKCIALHDKGKILEFGWELSQGTSINSAGSGKSGQISKNGSLVSSPLLPSFSHPFPSPSLPVDFRSCGRLSVSSCQGNPIPPPPLPATNTCCLELLFLLGTVADVSPPPTTRSAAPHGCRSIPCGRILLHLQAQILRGWVSLPGQSAHFLCVVVWALNPCPTSKLAFPIPISPSSSSAGDKRASHSRWSAPPIRAHSFSSMSLKLVQCLQTQISNKLLSQRAQAGSQVFLRCYTQ